MTDNVKLASERVATAKSAIAHVIHGQQEAVDLLFIALATGGHALLEGVPGVGKTTLAKTFATVAGLDFKRVQLTPDLMPSDVTGHSFYNQATEAFETRRGPAFTNILLADEINRAPPRTQSALLEVMEEHQVTIDGETHAVPDPFIVIATKNPIDIEGVYPLPEAQLDRFMLFIPMLYPDRATEHGMLMGKLSNGAKPEAVKDLAHALTTGLADVQVHEDVVGYALDVVRATRAHEDVELGGGPRASEHLLRAARAHALLAGRDFVVPDDVKAMAVPVLAHRITLTADADIGGVEKDEVVRSVLDAVPVPVEA